MSLTGGGKAPVNTYITTSRKETQVEVAQLFVHFIASDSDSDPMMERVVFTPLHSHINHSLVPSAHLRAFLRPLTPPPHVHAPRANGSGATLRIQGSEATFPQKTAV